jgi:hypothetical protein
MWAYQPSNDPIFYQMTPKNWQKMAKKEKKMGWKMYFNLPQKKGLQIIKTSWLGLIQGYIMYFQNVF